MKKIIRIITMILCLCMLWAAALPASAETTIPAQATTAEEKNTERETTPAEEKTTEEKTTEEKTTTAADNTEISIRFKNGDPYMPQYVYTGKVIKPEIVIVKSDGTVPSPGECSVEYEAESKEPGAYHVTVTYLKNGYKQMLRYDIVPGTTDKINVKVKDGKVTVSWNPVPGAKVYRVYKYNEETGRYSEMWWSADEIASQKTSRTFTREELKPGGKYKMGIMALDSINRMPTDYMAYFTVDTTKDTDTSSTVKPVTPEKTTLITPQPTKAGVTQPKIELTTVKAAENTTGEKITVEENTTGKIENTTGTNSDVQTNSEDTEDEKAPVDRTKLIIIIVICVLAVAGIVFSVYMKKKK